ncbi:MAG: TAXI family TRAP transporter solute-binding subunit [Thermodesulfobacteriota bacterium]|nr:TAXI family TRAP transporter solute-binding subunit [Thermodesulfobacteriota bacterium]
MKKTLILVLAMGVVITWNVNVKDITAQSLPTILNIATHPIGTFFNMVGTAVATVVGKHTPIKTTVKPMAGPSAWYPLVVTQEIDLGVLNNWDAEKGYLGESVYDKLSKGKGFSVRLIAISVNNSNSLIVSADSGINKISDLKGKRISGNFPTPSLQLQTEAFLVNGGVSWSEIKPIPVSSIAEATKAIIEGRSDAANVTIGMPVIEELHAKRGARILPIDPSPEAVKRTREKFPGYPIKVTPGPGRTGVEKEQYLWAYDIYLIGREDLPDEAAYRVVKALWENYKDLGAIHVLLKDWTPELFVTKEALIPYHTGAIKFYKEKGVWTDEMVKLQEALLAKKK